MHANGRCASAAALSGVLLILTVASVGGLAWARYELSRNEAFLDATLDRFTSLVNGAVGAAQSYSLPLPVTLRFLEEAEGILQVIARYGQPTPKLKQRQIAMLIAFADNYRDLGRIPEWERRLAQAQRLAAELARDDAANPAWRWEQARAHQRMGDLHMERGDVAAALMEYRGYRDIIERLAAADPNNANWQRDLSVAHNKIADVLVAQGNLSRRCEPSVPPSRSAERLAKADPDNAVWQRDLTISYDSIGDILMAQGNLREALNSFRASLAIRERLAKADPNNAAWQHDLSLSYGKLGDVLAAQGNLTEAIESYRASLAHQ